jgi:hypothetical protein
MTVIVYIVHHLEIFQTYYKNWICFLHQVRGEVPSQVDLLGVDSLGSWTVKEVLSRVYILLVSVIFSRGTVCTVGMRAYTIS